MTARQTPSKGEQDQRDTITRLEVTVKEVILPTIKRIDTTLTGLAEKDFITKDAADAKYLTKADFRPYAVALSVIALGVMGGLVTAFLKVVLK